MFSICIEQNPSHNYFESVLIKYVFLFLGFTIIYCDSLNIEFRESRYNQSAITNGLIIF